MTLIGVISDTHGLLRPQIKEIFKFCKMIIHAGDIGKFDVYEELSLIAPVVAVRGNVDKGEFAQRFKYTEQIEILNFAVYLIHDISQLNINPEKQNINVVIYGHSHKASVKKVNEVVYFNPGSAGPRRFKLPITAGLLKVTEKNIETEIIEIND